MSSVGVDRRTLRPLLGWDHVVQSIGNILSTEIGSRIERRDFGSLVPALLDRPQNEENIINFYMAVAEALYPRKLRGRWYGEPRFRLERCLLTAHTAGQVAIALIGFYVPRGHLDDFREASPREVTYSVNRLADVVAIEAAA